jgi:hypothetical protein
MTTYLQTVKRAARPFDISRWLWDAWELPAVRAWLQTSRSRRQCLKRMEVAMLLYKRTLWWSLSLAFFPEQALHGVDSSSLNHEEFCWVGICLSAAAERQMLEHAADVGRSYREEPDVEPERLHELLMAEWRISYPVGAHNRYLFHPTLLGEGADQIRHEI